MLLVKMMMMKGLLLQDKRAISLIISYVLLIVIAVGIAAGVYSFLRFYVPSEEVIECPNDVSLIISQASCQAGNLMINLTNRGFFSIDGAYMKIGETDRVVKDNLCFDNLNGCNSLFEGQPISSGGIVSGGLKPGDTVITSFSYEVTGTKEIEIEPVIIIEDKEVACRKIVVTKTINCQ